MTRSGELPPVLRAEADAEVMILGRGAALVPSPHLIEVEPGDTGSSETAWLAVCKIESMKGTTTRWIA